MKRILISALCFMSAYAYAGSDEFHTWYAGTQYSGTVMTGNLAWDCGGGTCVLAGPYGTGLNMTVCKELSRKVGGLDYYYNDAGMTWNQSENRGLLNQCNSR